MNYGFLIRNDRCIGCHACSTACKSENDVPVGVNRTWVKNVEKGRYPDVRRTFQVTRCNHCANPPCVRICPVTAMYQRADGIVEFDPEICIGCKACLQACPYDAIHIDPESGTAAKCHFCAHRVEMNLEPACVVVCPEHAIIAGDMDDPDSEIARELARWPVTVRKPEQGTQPKLFYVDGDDAALTPTATERAPASFAWTDVVPLHGEPKDGVRGPVPGDVASAPGAKAPPGSRGAAGTGASPWPDGTASSSRSSGSTHASDASDASDAGRSAGSSRRSASGAPLRRGADQGAPSGGPIHIGEGRMAGDMVRNVYNAQHRVPWHWPVPAYLVTKAVAAGLVMILGLAGAAGFVPFAAGPYLLVGFLALLFTGATTTLLVLDLERPERFLSILYRPQWRSWLTRGAFLLVAFSLVLAAWWGGEVGALLGWWSAGVVGELRPWALGALVPLAAGVAVYTAYLFGQAEGRDLWQSTVLPAHLLVQALMAGAAALLVVGPFLDVAALGTASATGASSAVLLEGLAALTLLVDLLLVFLGEVGMPHAHGDAARAARDITEGRYRSHFWWGSIGLGHAVPLALLAVGNAHAAALAGVLALMGLYLYEHAFVMAPQDIPNS